MILSGILLSSIRDGSVIRKFVEAEIFKKRLEAQKEKGLLKNIQDEILRDPHGGDLLPGTGGIRKIRVAKTGAGKSGSYSVFYLDLPDLGITHLMFLLLKGEKENINDEEKNSLKKMVTLIKSEKSRG
jgi:hypothetical protein